MPDTKISPCIWSNNESEEAAKLYGRAFPKFNVTSINPVMLEANMEGSPVLILNGGPAFRPNHSISFFVVMEDEESIDHAYAALTDAGKALMPLDTYPWSERYAWVEDLYHVSWQLMKADRAAMQGSFIPCLMFSGELAGMAESAMNFYTSVFPESHILDINRYTPEEADQAGFIKHGRFLLMGQPFAALDSSVGPGVNFTEGISFVIRCDSQQEIDRYWAALTENGEEQMCGWLRDRFGVSWQVVPSILASLMQDPEKAPRVIAAFLKMKKLDIDVLRSA